jgi:hypothetical protein
VRRDRGGALQAPCPSSSPAQGRHIKKHRIYRKAAEAAKGRKEDDPCVRVIMTVISRMIFRIHSAIFKILCVSQRPLRLCGEKNSI